MCLFPGKFQKMLTNSVGMKEPSSFALAGILSPWEQGSARALFCTLSVTVAIVQLLQITAKNNLFFITCRPSGCDHSTIGEFVTHLFRSDRE